MSQKHLEYTTEQIRQDLAAREASASASLDVKSEENPPTADADAQTAPSATPVDDSATNTAATAVTDAAENEFDSERPATKELPVIKAEDEIGANAKESETKSKKKRRKKPKKKAPAPNAVATQSIGSANASNITSIPNRKSSLSSSGGSASAGACDQIDLDTESNQQSSNATSASIDDLARSELAVTANDTMNETNSMPGAMDTPRICDLHFFSDTEVANSPYGSRPSTPIQSDSEFEVEAPFIKFWF